MQQKNSKPEVVQKVTLLSSSSEQQQQPPQQARVTGAGRRMSRNESFESSRDGQLAREESEEVFLEAQESSVEGSLRGREIRVIFA